MGIRAVVKRRRRIRKGKGFSQEELKEVGLSFRQASKLGIPIDKRRSTKHSENVETLNEHVGVEASTAGIALDLTEVKGVGQKRSGQLKTAGIDSVRKLADSDPEKIAEKTGVSERRASRWVENAKRLLSTK